MRRWLLSEAARNLPLKLISIALAVLLFVVVHSEKQSLVQGVVSVSYRLPPGKLLAQRPPATVRIGVTGPLSRVQRLRIEDIPPITVDLSKASGGYYRFPEDIVPIPVGLRISFLRPDGFALALEATQVRELPVRLDLLGQPAPGFRIAARRIRPAAVRLSGPRGVVHSPLLKLRTEPLKIDGADGTRVETVRVVLPPGATEVDPLEVEATVEIVPVLSEATVRGVPVRVEDAARSEVALSATSVVLRLEGPSSILATLSAARLSARLRLGGARRAQLQPTIVGLPLGVRLIKITPPTVEASVSPPR